MAKIKRYCFLILGFIFFHEMGMTNTLPSEIRGQYQTVALLEKKLRDYETQLNFQNQRYLQVSKNKKDIELKILDLEKSLQEAKNIYDKQILRSQKLLGQNILNDLSQEETSVDLFRKRLIQKNLLVEIESLKKQKEINKDLQDVLNGLSHRYQEIIKIEMTINSTLNNLEKEKKELSLEYLKRDQEIPEQKIKKAPLPAPVTFLSEFLIPIQGYGQVESKMKKGVVIKYKGRQNILSPMDGKVIYSGELSTYGNVLMIDHGKAVRTVLLGEGIYNVKKGDTVLRGQVIGEAKALGLEQGKIYFELRKNNLVQNTLKVLSSSRSMNIFSNE